MRLVTWNVNSLRARLERVTGWVEANAPDVLLMQETKCSDATFPAMAFEALGYATVHHGTGQWNGVAIASRVGIESSVSGFFDEDPDAPDEPRALAATCGGIRCMSVYVPNGRTVDSEHFLAKLDWLRRLRVELDERYAPTDPIAIGGDWNIAPGDDDVWDIEAFAGMTHVTPAERSGLLDVAAFGLTDALRHVVPGPGPFSWWDYRGGNFHRGLGMRIDHFLLSAPVLARLEQAAVDRDARKGKQPSDHAPVVIDLSD